jgi:iron complex outermembrane recepter protein
MAMRRSLSKVATNRSFGNWIRDGTGFLACAAASFFTSNAWAVDEPGAGLEEIIVTATKRAENIQQTPIAVQAFTGGQLAAINAVEISDWSSLAPGLVTQDYGSSGDKRYVIRGVNSAGAGTVGVYLDDVVITGENYQDGGGQAPDVLLFDMDRIEVLKGPQGTTFGSSSMTGTIRFITAKPNLSDFFGSAGAGYRQTSGGGSGSQLEGMVNLPLLTDRFAIRLAASYLDNPGYVSNQFERDANETRIKASRATAKFAVNDKITLSALAMVQRTQADALGYVNTTGYSLSGAGPPFAPLPANSPQYFQDIYAREPQGNNMDMYELGFEDKESYGTYAVTGSRFDRDFEYTRDASAVIQLYLGLPVATTGRSVINYPNRRTVDSDEARFVSGWQGPLQFLVGFFFQNEQRDFESHVVTADPNGYVPANPTVLLARTQNDTVREKTVFGELSYRFSDEWKLTLGGRRYDISDTQLSAALVGFGGGPGAGEGPRLEFTDLGLIGRFNLEYTPTPHLLSYLQIAQGFRPGGANDQTAAAIAGVTIPAGFSSDSLINYEAGLKSSWLDNRLVANGALYFINWSKIQVSEQASNGSSTFPYTGNGGRATVKGIELEVETRPVMGLQLGAYYNYNQAELVADIQNPSLGLPGDPIPYVPRNTFTLNSSYEWPLGVRNLNATLGAEYAYISSRVGELQTSPPTFVESFPGYETTTLRAGVKKDRWSLLFNVANVFNDTASIGDATVQQGPYPEANVINRPRTFSVMFRTTF